MCSRSVQHPSAIRSMPLAGIRSCGTTRQGHSTEQNLITARCTLTLSSASCKTCHHLGCTPCLATHTEAQGDLGNDLSFNGDWQDIYMELDGGVPWQSYGRQWQH